MSVNGSAVRASKDSFRSRASNAKGPASQASYNAAAEAKAAPSNIGSQLNVANANSARGSTVDLLANSAAKSNQSQAGKLLALRDSADKSATKNQQVVLYEGPTDRFGYLKELQKNFDAALFEVSERSRE